MDETIARHIAKISGVCGGKSCIVGHRIRVMDIVAWHEMRGYSVDEIVTMFPGLSLSAVHAALAYYFDHREEIQEEFRQDELAAKNILVHHPSKIRDELSA
jgi:uncharacterized protein (DUF433 family)